MEAAVKPAVSLEAEEAKEGLGPRAAWAAHKRVSAAQLLAQNISNFPLRTIFSFKNNRSVSSIASPFSSDKVSFA